MMKKELNRRAFRKAFWAAWGRLIGVMLGAGAGSILSRVIGGAGAHGVGVAIGLAIAGFLLTLFAEYERELDP